MEPLQFPDPTRLPVLTDVVQEGVKLIPLRQPQTPDAEELARRVMVRLEVLLQERMRVMLEGVVETLITEQSAQLAEALRPDMETLVRTAIRDTLDPAQRADGA